MASCYDYARFAGRQTLKRHGLAFGEAVTSSVWGFGSRAHIRYNLGVVWCLDKLDVADLFRRLFPSAVCALLDMCLGHRLRGLPFKYFYLCFKLGAMASTVVRSCTAHAYHRFLNCQTMQHRIIFDTHDEDRFYPRPERDVEIAVQPDVWDKLGWLSRLPAPQSSDCRLLSDLIVHPDAYVEDVMYFSDNYIVSDGYLVNRSRVQWVRYTDDTPWSYPRLHLTLIGSWHKAIEAAATPHLLPRIVWIVEQYCYAL